MTLTDRGRARARRDRASEGGRVGGEERKGKRHGRRKRL